MAAAAVTAPEAPAGAATAKASQDSTHAAEPTLQELLDRADTLVARRGGSRAESARIYLTWDAPYGMPRARRTRTPMSHDPRAVDTLWLSFLPGRTSVGFLGFSADLYFRAAPGDTLGPWWHMEGAGQNRGELRADFGPDASFPQRQPWATGGMGGLRLYRTAASARLNINFAVSYTRAVPVNPDSVYTLCRVMLQHHRVLPGCSQPVCVEWATATLGYWLKDNPVANHGERFVSYASGESVCDSYLPVTAKIPKPPPAARPGSKPLRARVRKPAH